MSRGIRSSHWNFGGRNWKLSRSKIDLYLECPRCFYLDNKLGIRRPSLPSFNINTAVDILLKKEFDFHRADKTPHHLFEKFNIKAVPFSHPKIDTWRENFEGVQYRDHDLHLTISGAVDDLWQLPDGSVAVVDYKSTAKDQLDMTSKWASGYFRQLEVYQWLLDKNDINVSEKAYILYANGDTSVDQFNGQIKFKMSLHEHIGNTDWIEPVLKEIVDCLNGEEVSNISPGCEYCEYENLKSDHPIDSQLKSDNEINSDSQKPKTLFG